MGMARDEVHGPRSRCHFGSVDSFGCAKLAFETVPVAIPPELCVGYV